MCEFISGANYAGGGGFWEVVGYMGSSLNRDSQLATRSVLKDFTDDALINSAHSPFRNEAALTLKARWRRYVNNVCWWSL